MTTAEAICRAVAMFDGWYAEKAKEHGIDLTDDDAFQEFVAATPHPFPEPTEPDYPLGDNWQETNEFLTRPYNWFQQLDAETRVGYLEHLPLSHPNAADVHNSLRDWVIDAEGVETATGDGFKGPVNSEPGKALLAWLDGHGAPTHARFVALVLLLHRNTKTGHSWPSQSTIGGYAGLSVRSVMRAVQWLESEKVIERVKPHQHGGNRYASVVYRFTKKVPI